MRTNRQNDGRMESSAAYIEAGISELKGYNTLILTNHHAQESKEGVAEKIEYLEMSAGELFAE